MPQLTVAHLHKSTRPSWLPQVLNMKPPEILGLLEEAAGTKMYESKKQHALKTLEKKQIKLDEITKVWSCNPAGTQGCKQHSIAAQGSGKLGWLSLVIFCPNARDRACAAVVLDCE